MINIKERRERGDEEREDKREDRIKERSKEERECMIKLFRLGADYGKHPSSRYETAPELVYFLTLAALYT